MTGSLKQKEVRCRGSCAWVWGCVCRLLTAAKSQTEAETSQNYFYGFLFSLPPHLVLLFRLSTSDF